jgi:prevent-host-death family protein
MATRRIVAMHYVGIRELKNRLTYYLRLTQKGDSIIVTDRDVPIAILHSADVVEETAGVEERLVSLSRKGMVRLPALKGKLTRSAPRRTTGKPVSALIIEDRR